MAQAMAAGWLKTGAVPARQMVACAKNREKLCRTTGALGIPPATMRKKWLPAPMW